MPDFNSKMTRRGFLKTSASSLGAFAFIDRAFWSLTDGLASLGVPPPWFKGQVRTTYNYCDICPWRCGVVVKSVGNRVYKIDGNPKDPKSRGRLCARGQAGVSFLYDPDRLKQPMIRTGERGEGKFKNVSWEEALDYSAQKLKALKDKYGPESLAIFGHTSGDFWFTDYFAQSFGTVNSAKPSVTMCTAPREEASIHHHRTLHRQSRAGRLGKEQVHRLDRHAHRRGCAQHDDARPGDRARERRETDRRRPALFLRRDES